ncbi:13281_t:CDS:1, partial [Dentiscutata erythropus]
SCSPKHQRAENLKDDFVNSCQEEKVSDSVKSNKHQKNSSCEK